MFIKINEIFMESFSSYDLKITPQISIYECDSTIFYQ
jgi:hypothetical protein